MTAQHWDLVFARSRPFYHPSQVGRPYQTPLQQVWWWIRISARRHFASQRESIHVRWTSCIVVEAVSARPIATGRLWNGKNLHGHDMKMMQRIRHEILHGHGDWRLVEGRKTWVGMLLVNWVLWVRKAFVWRCEVYAWEYVRGKLLGKHKGKGAFCLTTYQFIYTITMDSLLIKLVIM